MADVALYTELSEQFPWMKQIGLTPAAIQNMVATSANAAELTTKIRNTPQYKQRFIGLNRSDGSMRMNEAEYLRQESSYRDLLRQNGVNVDVEYSTPASLIGFFNAELSPDELRDRLQVWNQIKNVSGAQKDAFYVYAGMDISDDDLFEAVIDPAKEQALYSGYNARVAGQTLNYTTWITRATQAGLRRVATTLTQMKNNGTLTGAAVQKILDVNADFARQMMDTLYTAGDPSGQAGLLSLNELLDAFEFSAIGAAAANSGLELPTKERLAEIRAAGIDRSRAIQSYQDFGRQQSIINGAVQRARGTAFGQTEFEEATFLGNAEDARALEEGMAYMEGAGQEQGGFRFTEDRYGRLVQSGFTNQ